MDYWNFMRSGGRPAKRDAAQKAIDYAVAYSAGPKKLGHLPSGEIASAAARISSLAIERSLEDRIDEEGCGAFFAAAKYPQVDAFAVTREDRVSPVSSEPVTSDMSGGAGGDVVTFRTQRNQEVNPSATVSKSRAAAPQQPSTTGKNP